LDKVKKEMAKRDLSDVPTEKLFFLNLKLLDVLKSEESSMVLSERGEMQIDLSEVRSWGT
jgi:hypothetical protein